MKTSLPVFIQKIAQSQKFCEERIWASGRQRERNAYMHLFRVVRFARKICAELWAHVWLNLGADLYLFTYYYRIIKVWTCASKQVVLSLPFLSFSGKISGSMKTDVRTNISILLLFFSLISLHWFSIRFIYNESFQFFFEFAVKKKNIVINCTTHINCFASKRYEQPICSVCFWRGTSLGSFSSLFYDGK